MVAIDEAVFLRPFVGGEGNGGDLTFSLGAEVFLESHENGLVNFLVIGAGGGGRLAEAGGAGGGGVENGASGRGPERPCIGVTMLGFGGNSGG